MACHAYRGVLMDVGHGSGSFSWPVVERCLADAFLPDCISTDIWTLTSQGPLRQLLRWASIN